jgi:hypothetical protein
MTKVAFLFLTRGEHHNVVLWEQFFRDVSPDKYKIVLHAKNPAQLQSPLWANRTINTIPTAWGTISLVKATIFLLQHALTDPLVSKFVLLSEFCIPTTNFDNVYAHLTQRVGEEHKSFIHYVYGKNIDRFTMVKSYLPPALGPGQWAKQSQWMCLARKHAQMLFTPPYQTYMLQWLNDFKYCPAPDEHFFINFYLHICRLPETDFTNMPVTYVDWHGTCKHPKAFAFLPRELIEACRVKHMLFARKFYRLPLYPADVQYVLHKEIPLSVEQKALLDFFSADPLGLAHALSTLTPTQVAQMYQALKSIK